MRILWFALLICTLSSRVFAQGTFTPFTPNHVAYLTGTAPPEIQQPVAATLEVSQIFSNFLYVIFPVGPVEPQSGRIYLPDGSISGLTIQPFGAPVHTFIATNSLGDRVLLYGFFEVDQLLPEQTTALRAGSYYLEVTFPGGLSITGPIVPIPEPSCAPLSIAGAIIGVYWTIRKARLSQNLHGRS